MADDVRRICHVDLWAGSNEQAWLGDWAPCSQHEARGCIVNAGPGRRGQPHQAFCCNPQMQGFATVLNLGRRDLYTLTSVVLRRSHALLCGITLRRTAMPKQRYARYMDLVWRMQHVHTGSLPSSPISRLMHEGMGGSVGERRARRRGSERAICSHLRFGANASPCPPQPFGRNSSASRLLDSGLETPTAGILGMASWAGRAFAGI